MIWAIVYGGLAVATVMVVAVPAVRIAKQAKGLSRVLAASGARIDEILADIERARGDGDSRRRPRSSDPVLVNPLPQVEDGRIDTYHPESPGNFARPPEAHPRARPLRGS